MHTAELSKARRAPPLPAGVVIASLVSGVG
jgi:hypothetical protein